MTPFEGLEPVIGRDLDHRELMVRTAEQAAERGLDDVFIVDADFHHLEDQAWTEILAYVDNDVVRHFLRSGGDGAWWAPGAPMSGGMQEVQGRIQPFSAFLESRPDLDGAARDIARVREAMEGMRSDYVNIFPTQLLDMGFNNFRELEVAIGEAWARWVTERVLAEDPRITTLLFLPFGDADACMRIIDRYGDRPGVVGAMVTTVRYDPTFRKEYMKVYRALEERGLALGFHGSFNMADRAIQQFNRFISIHSIGFPLYHMIQCTNWVINGLPELFPNLKLIFIEGGLAWVPFLMQRLDSEFLSRPSEAPLLKRRPSEYMRDFYYTTQPLESADPRMLQLAIEMIGTEQLLWASDWPHWDWDPPARIWDIPFIDEQAKRNILGENARRVFHLPPGSGADRDLAVSGVGGQA